MKRALDIMAIVIVTTLSLYAQDIDTQMQMIREASPQERVEMMNKLKRQIVQMNQNDRAQAIARLRAQMKEKNAIHQSVARDQFQNSGQMLHTQTFNQQQAAKGHMQNRGENSMKQKR